MYNEMVGGENEDYDYKSPSMGAKSIPLRRKAAEPSGGADAGDGKVPKWKAEREKFIQAIRLGKQIQALESRPDVKNNAEVQSKIRALADKIPSQSDGNLVQCPYCNRKFNQ